MKESLLSGRNPECLNDEQKDRVRMYLETLGYHGVIEFIDEACSRSCFKVRRDEHGQEYGVIRIGSDIYPGKNVINPNASLDMMCALCHEYTHYIRWENKMELSSDIFEEIITSLQAIANCRDKLNTRQLEQLSSDALYRLMEYIRYIENPAEGDNK
ncbi:hypothetical protein KJ633_00940 [bacterium]|nr:hypothetical protein [bacterium]